MKAASFIPLLTLISFLHIAQAQQKTQTPAKAKIVQKNERVENAQADKSVVSLKWDLAQHSTLDERQINLLSCNKCERDPLSDKPLITQIEKVSSGSKLSSVRLKVLKEEELTPQEAALYTGSDIAKDYSVTYAERRSAGVTYAVATFNPIRKVGSRLMKLMTYKLDYQFVASSAGRDGGRANSWKANSVLSSGEWYKIATAEDGIYKVDYRFLEQCGLSVSGLASNQIRLYGTGGGKVDMDNSMPRPDDLEEIAILVEDGGDGIMDRGDYFLFYGEDQVVWSNEGARYEHDINPFADSVFYFLTINGGVGSPARVQETSASRFTSTTTQVDYYDFYEQDLVNVIQSGRTWYADEISVAGSQDFGFTVPNAVPNSTAFVKSSFISRSVNIPNTKMTVSVPNQNASPGEVIFNSVAGFYGAPFAQSGSVDMEFTARSGNFLTKLTYDNSVNSQAQAWVDYISVNARRNLIFNGPFMKFSDHRSVADGALVRFRVDAGSEEVTVWDITDPLAVQQMQLSRAQGLTSFNTEYDTLRTFLAFDGSQWLTPQRVGFVENQNLHSLSNIKYVVVSHENFVAQAQELADFHEQYDGFSTAVVPVKQIYNEFSGGAADITAIKEFMRMLYHRAIDNGGTRPEYLLLFGDASYDFKDRISGNSNFIPAHQTINSLIPTTSVVSDDYFGLMDDDEGESPQDLVDIGIGRLPARSRSEAQNMVNKIIHYTRQQTFGAWRNEVVFVADDEDGNTYMEQSDALSSVIKGEHPEYNIDKIYLDAYKQSSGAGGERYPSVNVAINDRISSGALIMYYIGHGGELGWAHERVLEVVNVNGWQNMDNMTLLITATCEFSRFDDPRRTSAGEFALLNPNGGAVALLTTTRAVYSSPNFVLTQAFTDLAYDTVGNVRPRLGDLARITKVRTVSEAASAAANSRCFSLLGDPGLMLAYPQKQVMVENIPDTVKALEKVTVSGYIADEFGNKMSGFNGVVYPLLFDKEATLKTLNNDGIGEHTYTLRKNALFRGKASVKDGDFSFDFVVPRDIDLSFGGGKLSFYAENGEVDANGAFLDFTVGGVSDNPITDNQGPDADLFMNDNKFVFGGLTDENPELYAEVSDSNGINMVGNGIGHDITAVLDDNTKNTIVLNDFYESDLDSYQSGKIRYPFNNLEDGRHTLKLQVWDVNNNPSTANTEFVVADNEQLALEHILNYPNPFTTNTQFYFEHNKPGQSLDVRIEVFTVSGKLVKTIDTEMASEGYRVGPIAWDGKDQYGDKIGRGVYIYRLSVKTPIGERANEFERLVILN